MPLLTHFFPSDESFSFEAIRAVGFANYGGADISEVISICQKITPGNEDAWMRERAAAADRARLHAENSVRVFSREAPFEDPILKSLSEKSSETFLLGAHLLNEYTIEEISIPYEGTTLPGFFMTASSIDPKTPRPTVIFNGGYDSTIEEAYFAIGPPALARGFNLLAFDGPGQGAALRKQKLFFRPDWEKVITPVVDFALSREDILKDGLVLFGYSLGGYLVARAVCSEHRIAALVLNDGVFDFGWGTRKSQSETVQEMVNDPEGKYDVVIDEQLSNAIVSSTGLRWGILNGKWTFGVKSASEFLRLANTYTLAGRVESITTRTLVLDAVDDHMLKAQPQALYEKMKCQRDIIKLGEESDGGGLHCAMGRMERLHQVIFDWLMPIFK